MLVKIQKRNVEVLDRDCGNRSCFALGFDKGSYSAGRGYTYRRDAGGRVVEKAVCGTRHYRGCPVNSVCPTCRLATVKMPGSPCEHAGCSSLTVRRDLAETTCTS